MLLERKKKHNEEKIKKLRELEHKKKEELWNGLIFKINFKKETII